MSIAWTTVVLLIFLLPGILFFVGVYAPERLSRDAAPRSPLGQLAGVVLAAFITHALFYLVLQGIGSLVSSWHRIDLVYVFAALQLVGADRIGVDQLAAHVDQHAWQIILYVLLTSAAGFGVGLLTGRSMLQGKLRGLATHGWIYDLIAAARDGGWVHVFVLTHIRYDNRVLMYRGYLKEFYFSPEGKISYLLLKDCQRYYLMFGPETVTTSERQNWREVGASNVPRDQERAPAKQWSYLMIEGDDIANIVLEKYQATSIRDGVQVLKEELRKMKPRPQA